MAVSVDTLRTALRLGDTAEERALATRLLKTAKIVVEKQAPRAPTAIKDEACIRLAAYWYDQPNAGRGAGYANALRNSGALALVSPYRLLKARVT